MLTVNSIVIWTIISIQLIFVSSLSDYEMRRNFIRNRVNSQYAKEHKELPTQEGEILTFLFIEYCENYFEGSRVKLVKRKLSSPKSNVTLSSASSLSSSYDILNSKRKGGDLTSFFI